MKIILLILAVMQLSNLALAQQQQTVIISAGKQFQTYTVGEKISLSERSCLFNSNLVNTTVLNLLSFESKEGYYINNLRLNSPLKLEITNVLVENNEGTDCNYRGFAGEDPDWNCSDRISGYWTRVVFRLVDSYNNEWTFFDKTEFTSSQPNTTKAEYAARFLNEMLTCAK